MRCRPNLTLVTRYSLQTQLVLTIYRRGYRSRLWSAVERMLLRCTKADASSVCRVCLQYHRQLSQCLPADTSRIITVDYSKKFLNIYKGSDRA